MKFIAKHLSEICKSSRTKYCFIATKGHLSAAIKKEFADMKITATISGNTLFEGEIQDQAHLFGVLNRIRDLGIEILSIEYKISE